ncbi:MAG: glycosyltransferase family 2 protein [Clostridia bacterium]|nr:glycosyltransferase family 2 protein [Clostridia bacterium]
MRENEALVSVIVPVYGTEAYLPACIDSICKQTYKNIQIILVDDNSPDKCPEICDSYAQQDSRIIVIHQENKGVSGARNTGLRHAKGDYLVFVDSDDELYSDAVELLLNDANTYNADVVSAVKKVVRDNSVLTCFRGNENVTVYRGEEALLLSLNGDKNTNSSCAKLFKTAFVNGCFFEEGKNINEDMFFVFQCYTKKPILVHRDIFVYKYNTRVDSNSRQVFSDKYFSMLYFCERKKEIIAEKFPEYIEQAYNMEVRTHLLFLQVLCRTNEKKYKNAYKESAKTVRKLYKYHRPINKHHKMLAWLAAHGMYPLYKFAVRLKYYR